MYPIKAEFFSCKRKSTKKILSLKLTTLEEIDYKFYSKDIWSTFLKNSNKLIDERISILFWNA